MDHRTSLAIFSADELGHPCSQYWVMVYLWVSIQGLRYSGNCPLAGDRVCNDSSNGPMKIRHLFVGYSAEQSLCIKEKLREYFFADILMDGLSMVFI